MPSLCNKKEIQMLQFFCSELSLSRVQFLLLFLMALCYKLINFKIFNARKHKKTLKEQGWLSSKNFTKDPKFCKMNYANITKATPNKNTHCSYKTKKQWFSRAFFHNPCSKQKPDADCVNLLKYLLRPRYNSFVVSVQFIFNFIIYAVLLPPWLHCNE